MILAPILLAAAVSQAEPVAAAPVPQAAEPASAAARLAALGATAPVLSGFLQAGWSSTDAPAGFRDENGFGLRQARLQVAGHATSRLSYLLEADVAERDAGQVVKDAYLAWRLLPGTEVRLGQFKTPFGWEQQEPEARLLWLETSHVVAGLARGPASRDLGVGVFGAWGPWSGAGLEVSAAEVNGAGPNTADELIEKNTWARVGGSYALGGWKARAGFSYGYGRQLSSRGGDGLLGTADDVSFYFHRFGGDLQLDTPWLFAEGEVILGRTDLSTLRGVGRARGEVLGVYGKTPWGLGPIVRLDDYDPDDRISGNGRQRITLGAYYDLLPEVARLVFNYDLDRSAPAVKTGNKATLAAQVLF